jgi:hypothetical protein
MTESTEKFLTRDCEAVQIPNGNAITLQKGSRVFLTQTLGGSYTVMCDFGLARIDGAHADALGLDPAAEEPRETAPEPELNRAPSRTKPSCGPSSAMSMIRKSR